jgi:hypothetical protein
MFVDGVKTMDFIKERIGSSVDGYEFVNINDYTLDPEIGQVIMLTDRDLEDRCNFFIFRQNERSAYRFPLC